MTSKALSVSSMGLDIILRLQLVHLYDRLQRMLLNGCVWRQYHKYIFVLEALGGVCVGGGPGPASWLDWQDFIITYIASYKWKLIHCTIGKALL